MRGGHARRNNQAGFLAGRFQILPRVVVNAGFRVEDNDSFGTNVVPRVGVAFTPRIGGEIFGATRLRFTYGEGIKEPRLDQTFGTDVCNPGNPALLPEQSRTIYTGIEQHLAHDRVRVSADYFDSRFRDIVSFTFCFPGGPCPVAPPGSCPFGFGTYFNTDLARARGTTISAEARLNSRLSLSGNYTLDDTLVLQSPNAFDPAQAPGNRLIRRPVHSGNIVLTAGVGRFRRHVHRTVCRQANRQRFPLPAAEPDQQSGLRDVQSGGHIPDRHLRHGVCASGKSIRQTLPGASWAIPLWDGRHIVGMRFTFGGE